MEEGYGRGFHFIEFFCLAGAVVMIFAIISILVFSIFSSVSSSPLDLSKPFVKECENGRILKPCICGFEVRSSGYCCFQTHRSFPCLQ
jgi:hypothetical protein